MKTINTDAGYFKVYWDLFNDENLDTNSIVLFSYITSVYDILKETHTDKDTGTIYKRLSNSFIQERLFDFSDYIIRESLKKLEAAKLIECKELRMGNDRANHNRKGNINRYIKLLVNDKVS